ncbi:MAG: NifU N-terminal domain-containing protein [Phycisphaerales bacterium]|nr:NifU N-terminal domain-containing protein [Phycisphaerales bacterium]
MPYAVVEYETTPNPNAMKCWLDQPISEGPESFFNAEAAAGHPIAKALFATGKVNNLLFNGTWLTVGKIQKTTWPTVKKHLERVLAEHEVAS